MTAVLAASVAAAQTPTETPTQTPTISPTPGGNCCAGHGGPSCDNPTCAACVCSAIGAVDPTFQGDPLCCAPEAAGWDKFCAAEAADPNVCGASCPCITPTPTPGGDCCSPHAGGSCDTASCRDCVCAIDGVCCSEEWDAACVVTAGKECVAMCPCGPGPTATATPTPTPGGDCCTAHAGGQCNDARCEECVCALDAPCCDSEWDQDCVDESKNECVTDCACEGAVSCCSTHDVLGCSDTQCQDCVCGTDPACCTDVWDDECVSEATKECAISCTCDTAGDCCAAHDGIGCDVDSCQACVCGIDSSCCSDQWDQRCVDEAADECAPSCPCDTTPCCEVHAELGCGEDTCQNCVCTLDSACCTEAWDQRCVEEAEAECAPRCTCKAPGDCCVEQEEPGCSDAECAACVCDIDDVCCTELWDADCVAEATNECHDVCQCVPQTDCCLRGRDDPGCESVECADCVCGFDDVCCNDVWDDTCVEIADDQGECNSSCKCICVGDCGNDGKVSIDDLVRAVKIAVAGTLPTDCLLLDADINGVISIDELIQAVDFALEGCTP